MLWTFLFGRCENALLFKEHLTKHSEEGIKHLSDFTPRLIRCFPHITSSVLMYSCALSSHYYCTLVSPGALS